MDYQQQNISTNNFEQCTKCTICTVYCPVTAVNPAYPGPKQAGPDGERYRLKDPKFYSETLKYCLNCKRCEVACPSDVRIGDIIQSARITYSRNRPGLREFILANTDLMGGMATMMAPIVNTTLRIKPVKAVMDAVIHVDRHRTFPKYASQRFDRWFAKEAAEAQKTYTKKIGYFHGCYVNYNNPQLGRDFVRVMNALGYGVELLDKERCCGVAKIANGLIGQARRDAATNTDAIRRSVAESGTAVVGTSSTCIFTMRDEYPHLLGIDNSDVRDHIDLATRFIYHLVDSGKVKLAFDPKFSLKAAYHTPCHMERLGWSIYSISLLRMIPGLQLTVLDSQCCGIAGTYGFKSENYPYSQKIGQGLFDQIRDEAPDVVVTDCETCKWQIEMSTGATVENPITILANALDLEATAALNKK